MNREQSRAPGDMPKQGPSRGVPHHSTTVTGARAQGSDLAPWLARCLSEPRLGPYLAATGGSETAALELYRWNTDVSAALHAPLHLLEVGFRNALHEELAGHFGRADWWEAAPLDKLGGVKVDDAIRAFVHYQGSRRQLEDWMRSALLLRNRIAHHEHIHGRDLLADHAKVGRLLGYLSVELAAWAGSWGQVEEVLDRRLRLTEDTP